MYRKYNILFYIVLVLSVLGCIYNSIQGYNAYQEALSFSALVGGEVMDLIENAMMVDVASSVIWIAGVVFIILYKKIGFWLCVASRVLLSGFMFMHQDIYALQDSVIPVLSLVGLCLWMLTKKNGYTVYDVLFYDVYADDFEQPEFKEELN